MVMMKAIAVKDRLRRRILKPLVLRKKNIAENVKTEDTPTEVTTEEERRDETTEAIRDRALITSIRALLFMMRHSSTELGVNAIRDIEGEVEVEDETAFKEKKSHALYTLYILLAAAILQIGRQYWFITYI